MNQLTARILRAARLTLARILPRYGYELVRSADLNPNLRGNVFDDDLITCNFCGSVFMRSGDDHPEALACPQCDAIARERVMYQCILEEINQRSGRSYRFFRQAGALKKLKMLECSPRNNPTRRRIYYDSLESYIASDFDMSVHRTDIRLDVTQEDEIAPYLGAFDMILFAHVLEHIPDYVKALENIHRMLSPDGFLVLQVPLLENSYTPVTWDEFHQDNTRVYHRFGFDLVHALDLIYRDVKIVVGMLDFPITSPEIKPEKYALARQLKDRCILLGPDRLRFGGLGIPDLCDAFIAHK